MSIEPCLVVFDVDGTLVDAQANIVRGFTDAFFAAGLAPPSADAIRRGVGLSIEVAIAELLPEADLDVVRPLARACREAVWDLRQDPKHAEPLYPGALAALDRLAADGVVLAVATGKGRRGLDLFLEQHELARRFTARQTADDAASKPSPEMLLNIMAATGIDRARTLMIGDTSFDMGMARAARVSAIGVGWGYHEPQDLMAAGARQVLALAVWDGRIDADAAAAATLIDETVQNERWGEDEEARDRRERLIRDIRAAGRFLSLLRG